MAKRQRDSGGETAVAAEVAPPPDGDNVYPTAEGLDNGTGNGANEAAPGNGSPAAPHQDSPPVIVRPKRASEVFYLLVGESKDGSCMDVLGEYATRNRAERALEGMELAVQRHYVHVKVFQCRDRTSA